MRAIEPTRAVRTEADHHLFVYGTLMSRYHNAHAVALRQAANLLGRATLRGRMHVVQGPRGTLVYPAVVASDDPADVVRGEVYRVEDPGVFDRLDRYEGAEYERRTVAVELGDGRRLSALAYLFLGATDRLPRVPSGDFAAR
ncbi:gamma-glutamylcyclotransferase family protein [Botrimarina sp.]|uniref:gamma-glutamylcyclotransferase family protein n=1 Tax=Botrimarina sp. TaxID=2795802 RepID=UPI0032EAA618